MTDAKHMSIDRYGTTSVSHSLNHIRRFPADTRKFLQILHSIRNISTELFHQHLRHFG